MPDQKDDGKQSNTEFYSITEMATVYAFLETNASVEDKLKVLAKAERTGDGALLEAKLSLERTGVCESHSRMLKQGKTFIPTERVKEAGSPTLGDAIAAAESASDNCAFRLAAQHVAHLYNTFQTGRLSNNKLADKLRNIAQSLALPSDWKRVDPWEAYLERERLEPGVQFFVDEIDNITMGCPPGRVATIAAYTGHGKSTFIKNMAYLNAIHHGVDGPFLTLEDTPADVEIAFVVRHSLHSKWGGRPPLVNTPTLNAALAGETRDFYKEVAYDWVNGDHAQISVCGVEHLRGKYNIESVISLIKSFKPYKAVYIDYMNMFKTFDVPGAKGEYERINFAASMIRNEICLDREPVPLVQCCQINRKGYERYVEELSIGEPGGYMLCDMSESNEMEKGSSFVVTMFLDDDRRSARKISVQLIKGRGSAIIETPFDVNFAPEHFSIAEALGDTRRFASHSSLSIADLVGE